MRSIIYCNGSGRTYLAFARGFYIRDLLDYAGVDVNSIASIDFFTKDHSVGAYRSFTKYALLDQPLPPLLRPGQPGGGRDQLSGQVCL